MRRTAIAFVQPLSASDHVRRVCVSAVQSGSNCLTALRSFLAFEPTPTSFVINNNSRPSLEQHYHGVQARSRQLPAKVQKIQRADITFEDCGQKLHKLLTEPHRKAKGLAEKALYSKTSRKGLVPGEIFQPRLTGLPVELIDNIAIRLDVKFLGNFRLTCKTLKVKIAHHFLKEYLISRVVKPEWDSIRRLLMILDHPGIGSAVRDATIDASDQASLASAAASHRPTYGSAFSRRHSR